MLGDNMSILCYVNLIFFRWKIVVVFCLASIPISFLYYLYGQQYYVSDSVFIIGHKVSSLSKKTKISDESIYPLELPTITANYIDKKYKRKLGVIKLSVVTHPLSYFEEEKRTVSIFVASTTALKAQGIANEIVSDVMRRHTILFNNETISLKKTLLKNGNDSVIKFKNIDDTFEKEMGILDGSSCSNMYKKIYQKKPHPSSFVGLSKCLNPYNYHKNKKILVKKREDELLRYKRHDERIERLKTSNTKIILEPTIIEQPLNIINYIVFINGLVVSLLISFAYVLIKYSAKSREQ